MTQTPLRAAQGPSLIEQQSSPIGVFDSGVGGLSVWRHLRKALPHEDFIYVADTQYVPYGDKSEIWIRERVDTIVQWFLRQNCKAVVLACNTATAAAATYLRQRYPDLFLVGLEPAIKPAIQLTRNHTIAMLATARTVSSAKYAHLLANHVPENITVLSIACVGLAERIDTGDIDSPETLALIEQYVQQAQTVDVIVLGCTHYPFVSQHIKKYISDQVKIIDSGAPVARYTKDVLTACKGLNPQQAMGRVQWFASQIKECDIKRWTIFCGEMVDGVRKLEL